MKKYVLLLSLFASSSVLAQDVLHERLVGFSYYEDGLRSDSASFAYEDKFAGGDASEARTNEIIRINYIDYQERLSYNHLNQERTKTVFLKNGNKAEMLASTPDDAQLLQSDYIEFYKDSEKPTRRIIKSINKDNQQLQKYFNRFVEYNSNGLPIRDSSASYFGANEYTSRSIEHYYLNGQETHRITKDYNSDHTPVVNVRVDSLQGNKLIEYHYTIREGVYTTNEAKLITKRDDAGLETLRISMSYIGQQWDTISYRETQYLKSYENGLLTELITKMRLTAHEHFLPQSKINRAYTQNKLLTNQKIYNQDSIENWKLAIQTDLSYDRNNRILNSTRLYHNTEQLDTEDYSYNELGNITSSKVNSSNNFNSYNFETYYYYEPYLEKELNLNYTQLIPITYPNPFESQTTILFSCIPNSKGTITVYDMSGRQVHTHNFESQHELYQYTWDASTLPSGQYYARIIMGNEKKTIKLIKQ